ncbi:MAG: hypothetical protein ACEQSA_00705 [Weeksellaceae bacterium]
MNKRKGEISTLLLLGTLAIIGVATLVTSTLNQNRQTTQTRADETWQCPGGNCDKCGVDGWWGSGCTQFCEEHPGDAPGCAAPPGGGGNQPTTPPGGGNEGDGPGGLCAPNRGGADSRGCGGFDGCRDNEKCAGTCLWQNVPANQTCGGSSVPTPTLRPITPMVTVITPPPAGGGGTQPTTPPSGGGGNQPQPTTPPQTAQCSDPNYPFRFTTNAEAISRCDNATSIPLLNSNRSCYKCHPRPTSIPAPTSSQSCPAGYTSATSYNAAAAICEGQGKEINGALGADPNWCFTCGPRSGTTPEACPAEMPNRADDIERASLACRSQNKVIDRSQRVSDGVCYSCKSNQPTPAPTYGPAAGNYCNQNSVCEYYRPVSECEPCATGTRCVANSSQRTASCVEEGVRSQTVVAPETAVFEACEDINNPTDGCVILPI